MLVTNLEINYFGSQNPGSQC